MQNIEQLFNQWQESQPLKAEDKKRLDDKFNLEFNYNSNHIEGNTLTYGQTKLLLMFGEATGDVKMRDLEEMKAHNVGLRWIRERAKETEYTLSERDIRDLNRIILVEDFYKINPKTGFRYKIHVGVYKTRPNSVITATGEEFSYASPEETPALMYELIKWFNAEVEKAELTPIELASLLHYRYIRIHPFEDGNGRIARLLVTYVLERFGCPMVIIKSENKEEYLRVLHQCDINVGLTPSDGASASIDDIAPFVAYMKRQLEWSLTTCIKAAKGESIEEKDDFSKKLTMMKKQAEQKTEEENNKVRIDPTEVWNVLEFCFFPITEKIAAALEPTMEFFSQRQYYNLLFKKGYDKGLHVNSVQRDSTNSQLTGFIRDAKNIKFVYELMGGMQEYFTAKSFKIEEAFLLTFEEDHYVILYNQLGKMGKLQFNYQNYPSVDMIEEIVSSYKNSVLSKIDSAIKK